MLLFFILNAFFFFRILVDPDDPETLDFFSSCESYRRAALVTGQCFEALETVSYSIAGVLTPLHYRKKGYAKKMLNLLQETFATTATVPGGGSDLKLKGVEKNGMEKKWQGGKDAAFSFLFSDIGDSYSTIGRGWHVRSSESTIWTLSTLPAVSFSAPSDVKGDLIKSSQDLYKISLEDALQMKASLTRSPQIEPNQITIAIKPTLENYEWAIHRSNFYAKLLHRAIPYQHGIKIDRKNFILYIPDYPNETLKIVRLSCFDPKQFGKLLLRKVFQTAKEWRLEKIEGWNIDLEILKQLREDERGTTGMRTDSLSCLSFYGSDRDGVHYKSEEVEWRFNEAYAWC